jgi:predicted ester cyclase
MSLKATLETMNAYLEALTDRAPLAPYFAPNIVFQTMGSDQVVRGSKEVEAFITWLHQTAFDARPEFKATIITDDRASLEAEFVGKHTGEFFGVPASYHNVRVPYSVFYDLDGDKITALRFYMPMNLLMEQIGPVASPAFAHA